MLISGETSRADSPESVLFVEPLNIAIGVETIRQCRCGFSQLSFCFVWIFCFRNHYSIYPPLIGICRPDQSARTAQADLVDTLRICVTITFLENCHNEFCLSSKNIIADIKKGPNY